jgi:hypothetical protein
MEFRQCQACQAPFRPRPQIADQRFCSAAACQRERRRRWQATKRQNDPDYRENQKRVQKAWAERHPNYWRDYRRQHPEYTERNRARQRQRAQDKAAGQLQRWTRQRLQCPFLQALTVCPRWWTRRLQRVTRGWSKSP